MTPLRRSRPDAIALADLLQAMPMRMPMPSLSTTRCEDARSGRILHARAARIRSGVLAASLYAFGGMFASAGASPAHAQPPAPRPAAAAADTHTQARDAQRDEAVAAALVAALEQELGGRRIRLRLDPANVGIASIRDRMIEGRGTVSIGDGDDWLGLRYRVLYDAMMGTTGYPELHLGGMEAGSRVLPNDAALVSALDGRVLDLLAQEFGHQQARMQLDRILTVETGSRYLRIDAEGMVDFGRDGTAPVRVEGLYGRIDGDWLRVAYALEPGADADADANAGTGTGSGSGAASNAGAPGAGSDSDGVEAGTSRPGPAPPGSRPVARPAPLSAPVPRAAADGG